jgi:hypothetical protein
VVPEPTPGVEEPHVFAVVPKQVLLAGGEVIYPLVVQHFFCAQSFFGGKREFCGYSLNLVITAVGTGHNNVP